MRINHNISAMITQDALSKNQTALSSSLQKLSTGLRINSAADDAAGLSISQSMTARINGMTQAKQNANDGSALLNIAEGAAGQINDILQRMSELAIQSATDTMTTTERSYTDTEFSQLSSEIQRISGSASYNGMTLLDGSKGSFGAVGSNASVLHIGPGSSSAVDRITISISAMTLGALGLANAGVSTDAAALSALSLIDSALTSVNTMRADVGAYVNRLQFAMNNLDNQIYNTQDAESRVADVDFASETTEFTRAQILSQSATAMLSQANQIPENVLALFQ